MENTYCNGSGPHTEGTVKVMSTGGGGNLLLCRACWLREITWRKERNRSLGDFAQFDLPNWNDAKSYEYED